MNLFEIFSVRKKLFKNKLYGNYNFSNFLSLIFVESFICHPKFDSEHVSPKS